MATTPNTVQSCTGQVPVDELGLMLMHEHLRVRRETVELQFPSAYNDHAEFEESVREVRKAVAHGVKTICDPTVLGLGRDVRFAKAISESTGVNVVVATGIYTFNEVPVYFATRSIDHMAEMFVRDIEVGIQGTPIRAGFLKCVTDEPGVTDGVEMVLRAVARAHRATGAPIMTHSNPAKRTGLDQLRIFEDEGVDLSQVVIGHCGDTEDTNYLEEILKRGSFIGMDRYAYDEVSTDVRNGTVFKIWEKGYQDQLTLAHDFVCVSDRAGHLPTDEAGQPLDKWSMAHLFETALPQLIELGVPAAEVDALMTTNPRKWLTPCAPY